MDSARVALLSSFICFLVLLAVGTSWWGSNEELLSYWHEQQETALVPFEAHSEAQCQDYIEYNWSLPQAWCFSGKAPQQLVVEGFC